MQPYSPRANVAATSDSMRLAGFAEIPAIIWSATTDGYIRAASGAPLALFGVDAADLNGRPISCLFGGQFARHIAEAHSRALAGLRARLILEWNRREYEVRVEPVRRPGGAIEGAAGIAVDVTESRAAERALRMSEQSYRSLIEEAPYAICRCTVTGQLLQVNRAMLEILGYGASREAELLMLDLPQIFDSPQAFETLRDRLLAGALNEAVDAVWLGRNGVEVQVRVSGRAIRSGDEVLYLDVLAENVTEKKLLEAQLHQAQKMQALGQLAGGVAHDFNNLLTVIGGQVEMILCETVDSDIEERLRDIRKAADRAAALTAQLLAFSRRQVLQSRVLDLNDAIRRTSGLLSRLLRENVDLRFLPCHHPLPVRADPNQIEQVLMNLAINAQDAMPGGGVITVRTSVVHLNAEDARYLSAEPGDYVRVSVADTGHGMDAETQARIFEPFFTTKAVGEGTGLGLAMVYGVVRQSGGYIRVESRPGSGATFVIDLPRASGVETEPEEVRREGAPPGAETILLTEDEESVRRLVQTYLGHLGYRILTAANGAEAIEAACGHTGGIHLLITDVVMPGMSGRELAAELFEKFAGLRVLFVSGYAGDTVDSSALDASRAHFLQKPFPMDVLARKVRELLDGHHAAPAGA